VPREVRKTNGLHSDLVAVSDRLEVLNLLRRASGNELVALAATWGARPWARPTLCARIQSLLAGEDERLHFMGLDCWGRIGAPSTPREPPQLVLIIERRVFELLLSADEPGKHKARSLRLQVARAVAAHGVESEEGERVLHQLALLPPGEDVPWEYLVRCALNSTADLHRFSRSLLDRISVRDAKRWRRIDVYLAAISGRPGFSRMAAPFIRDDEVVARHRAMIAIDLWGPDTLGHDLQQALCERFGDLPDDGTGVAALALLVRQQRLARPTTDRVAAYFRRLADRVAEPCGELVAALDVAAAGEFRDQRILNIAHDLMYADASAVALSAMEAYRELGGNARKSAAACVARLNAMPQASGEPLPVEFYQFLLEHIESGALAADALPPRAVRHLNRVSHDIAEAATILKKRS